MPSYRIELIPLEPVAPAVQQKILRMIDPLGREMGRFRDIEHASMWLKDHRLCGGSRRYNVLKRSDKEINVEDMVFGYTAALKLEETK